MAKQMLQRADRLLAAHQWSTAVSVLKKLLDQRQDDRDEAGLVPRMVVALNHCHRFREAFDYASEVPGQFITSISQATVWLQAALGAKQFIDARLFITYCDEAWQESLLELVEQAEEKARQSSAASLKTQLQSFYHLGDQPVVQQSQLLNDGHKLPLAEYLMGAKFLLRDPFTNAFVRSNIIYLLQQLQVKEAVKYLWLDDKEYSVVPADLGSLEHDPSLNSAQQALKKRLADSDPVKYLAMTNQLNLQGMLLYPRIGEVITDPTGWVAILLGDSQADDPAAQAMADWQKKLNKELKLLESKII